ncbi:MAG TPA: type II secretion system F family protein [Kiritimatiellia bacterium]|nr:type II secretion system F family protein [Kiritimatiellia bacterium]
MKTFMYRGYDRDGARVRGVIEALDLKDAREKLAGRTVLPEELSAVAGNSSSAWSWGGGRHSMRRDEPRGEFYRAMSTMIAAGLPLVDALNILLEQTPPTYTDAARQLAGLRDAVRDGARLVDAAGRAGLPLTAFESAVLESGERTGNLAGSFADLADYLVEIGRIRQTIRTACLYPAIIVAVALLVGVGVMGFLVPRMAAVFAESGMPLPWLTRFVVAAGSWFIPVVLPVMLGLVLLVLAGLRKVRAQPALRRGLERRISRWWIAGHGFRVLTSLRFARTASLLLQGGLPMVDTIQLAGRATGSSWLAAEAADATQAIRQGAPVSRTLAQMPVLGTELGAWLRAGEASGDLAGMFAYAGERQRQKWALFMDRSVALIEPVLIVVVAVFVLLVALAILLPILSLNLQLG